MAPDLSLVFPIIYLLSLYTLSPPIDVSLALAPHDRYIMYVIPLGSHYTMYAAFPPPINRYILYVDSLFPCISCFLPCPLLYWRPFIPLSAPSFLLHVFFTVASRALGVPLCACELLADAGHAGEQRNKQTNKQIPHLWS